MNRNSSLNTMGMNDDDAANNFTNWIFYYAAQWWSRELYQKICLGIKKCNWVVWLGFDLFVSKHYLKL